MTVKNVKTGELTKIEADPKDGLFGLFGFIGMIPNTSVFADKVETDDKGYIKTDETCIPTYQVSMLSEM